MRSTIERACALANVELEVVAEVNSMHMQRSLVRHGVGWTVMPSASFFEDLSHGDLAGAPLASDVLQRHLALCLPVTRPASAATRCVTAILLELTQREVEEGRWPSARWVGPG
jgi:DNA-binding transcriptional LysR family regulator